MLGKNATHMETTNREKNNIINASPIILSCDFDGPFVFNIFTSENMIIKTIVKKG
jgi:hypothetical protein